MDHSVPTEDQVRDALRDVMDPEVGMNIVDLGLVYGIEVDAKRIHVNMTMTTPACRLSGYITRNAEQTLCAIAPAIDDIDIELV